MAKHRLTTVAHAHTRPRRGKAPSRSWRALALVSGNLALFLALVGILEGGARLFVAREIPSLFSDRTLHIAGRPFVEAHPRRGFALKPGFENELYRINRDGFRGPDLPRDLGDHAVLVAFGESTVFGWQVPEGETFPAHLRRLLRRRGLRHWYHVVNAGVPSYTSSQVLIYLEEVLGRRRVDLALVSTLWNDIVYSTLTHWYPDVLVFQQPPIWQRLLLRHSGVYRALMLTAPRGVGAEDVFNQAAFEQYAANIAAMIDVCARRGVELAFVEPPFDLDDMSEDGIDPLDQVRLTKPFFIEVSRRYLDRVRELASRRGVAVLDHGLSVRRRPPGELFMDLLHPTAKGNARMASDVVRELVAAGLVS